VTKNPITTRNAFAAGLAALHNSTFRTLHGVMDHWGQLGLDAARKTLKGDHMVYAATGRPVEETPVADKPADKTVCTATQLGRFHCTRHVAMYTAGQITAAVVVTRALGVPVPVRHLAAGHLLINATTHYWLDRTRLDALLDPAGKRGYVDHHSKRTGLGDTVQTFGPGTAGGELDNAAHQAIGLGAAVLSTMLTLRWIRKNRP